MTNGYVTNWTTTTIDGKSYLVIDTASFRVPLDWDPSSNMFIAVAAPNGALGNFPALVKGDPGDPPTIDTAIDFTALASGDPTEDYAYWTETSPGIYKMSLGLHEGATGPEAAIQILNALDLGGIAGAGKTLLVNALANGFEFAVPKTGDRYIPATISSVGAGNPNATLCSVTVPAQPWDWRPRVYGYTVITGTGTDVQVDLIARLNNETSGNIVGRATQPSGRYPATHVLVPGPPAGSSDAYDTVAAGAAGTVYLRTERQTGVDTYTTSDATTIFSVEVTPIP